MPLSSKMQGLAYRYHAVSTYLQNQTEENWNKLKQKVLQDETKNLKLDLSEIVGNFTAKRALEIAITGYHSITFIGPKGSGKSELRKFYKNSSEILPCPCGNISSPKLLCSCSVSKIRNFQARPDFQNALESDIMVETLFARPEQFKEKGTYESEEEVLKRVDRAQTLLNNKRTMTTEAERMLDMAYKELRFSPKRRKQIINVATTISALCDCRDKIEVEHIAEAVQYTPNCLKLEV